MHSLSGHSFADSLRSGAYAVVKDQATLDRINVFPVADADTGANLAATLTAAAAGSGPDAADGDRHGGPDGRRRRADRRPGQLGGHLRPVPARSGRGASPEARRRRRRVRPRGRRRCGIGLPGGAASPRRHDPLGPQGVGARNWRPTPSACRTFATSWPTRSRRRGWLWRRLLRNFRCLPATGWWTPGGRGSSTSWRACSTPSVVIRLEEADRPAVVDLPGGIRGIGRRSPAPMEAASWPAGRDARPAPRRSRSTSGSATALRR